MTNVFLSHIIAFSFGEVAEWFKAHAWKACKPFKGFGGSNPPLSASTPISMRVSKDQDRMSTKMSTTGTSILKA